MQSIIKNTKKLNQSPLRADMLAIAEAGLQAIRTESIIKKAVQYAPETEKVTIGDLELDLKTFKRIIVIGIGKAAFDGVETLQKMFGPKINCGFVIDVKAGSLDNIVCKIGTHPYPTVVNVTATTQLVELLKECGKDDLVLSIISGGGSSLLCLPAHVSCADEKLITQALMRAGAPIDQINIVRKHMSRIKGGQLAAITNPATMVNLIFSDVPSDDISVIASGPTVLDETTSADAEEVLKKYAPQYAKQIPLVETPKDKKLFRKIHNVLVCSATTATEAMRTTAKAHGYTTRLWNSPFEGEARSLGTKLYEAISRAQPKTCLIGHGESTVHVRGAGIGGRNQEMALQALLEMEHGRKEVHAHATNTIGLITLASDGFDNSPAAGALVDASTIRHMHSLHLHPIDYLENNDSYTFFKAIGYALDTGLTGSNVSDLVIAIKN